MSADVILLAAGSGRRFGGRREKQFLHLNKLPMFIHCCRLFSSLTFVARIVVVVPSPKVQMVKALLKKFSLDKCVSVVKGGTFRGESVKRGLEYLGHPSQIVMVHDAARPLVTKKIMLDVYRAAQSHGVALAAWPLGDTLKLADLQGRVKRTLSRERLWCAQTPQAFQRHLALRCLLHPSRFFTDDTALAERYGVKVKIVKASPLNIKVTYPLDIKMAAALQLI